MTIDHWPLVALKIIDREAAGGYSLNLRLAGSHGTTPNFAEFVQMIGQNEGKFAFHFLK
jgi:hypothetical protein